jgi:hypothetical protein
MTNHAQQPNDSASPEQLGYLRDLAARRGVSFEWPRDAAHAHRQIDAFLKSDPPPADDARRELQSVREEMAAGHGAAAVIEDDEIGGHGSSAHWR